MKRTDNNYQILGIECDKYGFPLSDLSDIDVQNTYINALEKLFIGLQPRKELSQEEILKQSKRCKEYLEQKLDGKDIEMKIKLMELMVKNTETSHINTQLTAFFDYIKEAYMSINTTPKREQYDTYLNQLTHRDLIEALNSYDVLIKQKYKDTEDITYGDLKTKNKEIKALHLGKNLRIFQEEEYNCTKITEQEKISSIKNKCILSEDGVIKCSLIARKNENSSWDSKEFYIGKNTIGKLMIPLLEVENPQLLKERKGELLSGILTAVKETVIKETNYVGEIINTENGIVCIKDSKMQKRIEELEERKRDVKKQYLEGESR